MNRLALTFTVLLASAPAAAVTVSTDFNRDLIIGPTQLMQTPGQAMTAAFANDGAVATGQVACRVPVPGCTSGPDTASVSLRSAIPGINATGSAIAGDDEANSSIAITSSGSSLSDGHHVLDLLSGDFQRLRFNLSGPSVPSTIDVDITFTVFAEVEDNSQITTGALYFPVAQALVEVLDSSTLDLVGPPPSVLAALSAKAFADDTTGVDLLANGVHTFSAKPNVDYWVRVITQVNLTLPVVGTSGDYAGLDLALSAFADPTFALNDEFAANNPQVAANLDIERLHVTTVPVPPALALLLSGLASGIGFRRLGSRT